MRLILASQSPTRRRMLADAGLDFEAMSSPLDEAAAKRELEGSSGLALAEALARLKAESVEAADALVIGSDQTLELDDGAILGKPGDRADLLGQLRAMSGRSHRLHSAVAVAEGGRCVWAASESVTMVVRPLSETFLQTYLDVEYDAVRGNVGGYRVEGPGAQLFERIDGSHFAVLGLPLLPLLTFLRARGILPS